MIKIILAVLALLTVGLLIYAATLPDSFRVQRTLSIKAPPEKIFPLIDDLHLWEAWSPWEKVDPALRRTYTGAQSGKGAVYEWSGNKDVGQGRMEIIDTAPPQRVLIKIDFFVPFEAHNTVEFTLQAQGETTQVSQAMYGPSPFISRLMGIFFSMDKMIGEKFEAGLAGIQSIAEAP